MADYSIWVLDYAAVASFHRASCSTARNIRVSEIRPDAHVPDQRQGRSRLVDTGYDHKKYGKYLADLYAACPIGTGTKSAGRATAA